MKASTKASLSGFPSVSVIYFSRKRCATAHPSAYPTPSQTFPATFSHRNAVLGLAQILLRLLGSEATSVLPFQSESSASVVFREPLRWYRMRSIVSWRLCLFLLLCATVRLLGLVAIRLEAIRVNVVQALDADADVGLVRPRASFHVVLLTYCMECEEFATSSSCSLCFPGWS